MSTENDYMYGKFRKTSYIENSIKSQLFPKQLNNLIYSGGIFCNIVFKHLCSVFPIKKGHIRKLSKL